jgi:hypothetical protein
MLGYTKKLAFDPLVVFEFLFPGQLPSPAHIPADFVTTWERTEALERLLDAHAEAAATLRQFAMTRTNKETAANLDLFAHILGELQRRWGGNAFDNRDTIYTGSGDDVRINDGVARYAADDGARALAIRDYTPTGRLARPLLSVRSVYDPLIGAYPSDRYPETVQLAGSGELFAQQYVRGDGHCTFRDGELAASFEALRRWRQTGVRPRPGGCRERGALRGRGHPHRCLQSRFSAGRMVTVCTTDWGLTLLSRRSADIVTWAGIAVNRTDDVLPSWTTEYDPNRRCRSSRLSRAITSV